MNARWLLACALVVLAAACQREARAFVEPPPGGDRRADEIPSRRAESDPFEHNAWGASEGARLYVWYNCVGCHAHGGGGMGPALMDDTWRYGSAPVDVFETIAQGRPNGMPAFGERLSDDQIWKLVTYVRSLSGQLGATVAPGRTDSMSVKPSESTTPRAVPRPGPPNSGEVP